MVNFPPRTGGSHQTAEHQHFDSNTHQEKVREYREDRLARRYLEGAILPDEAREKAENIIVQDSAETLARRLALILSGSHELNTNRS
jgi:hypothetical protein